MFYTPDASGAPLPVHPGVLRLEAARRARLVADAEEGLAVLDFYDAVPDPDERYIPAGVPAATRLRAFLQQTARALGKSDWTVNRQFTVLNVARTYLPGSFEVFASAGCTLAQLSVVVRQGDGLDDEEQVAQYDAAAAARLADPEMLPSELERDLHEVRERLDPASAERRRRRAAKRRGVRVAPLRDGQASLTITGDAVEVCAAADAIHQAVVAAHALEHPDEDEESEGAGRSRDEGERRGWSEQPGDREPGRRRSLGQLKADIALDLILTKTQEAPATAQDDREAVVLDGVDVTRTRVAARKPVIPTVLITIPADTACGGDTPGHLTGYGPIAASTARQAAGDAGYWTRLLTDPVTGGLVDIDPQSRVIPVAVRNWLRARRDTCGYPGCRRPEAQCDIDHATRFEYGGPTHPDNLSFLCRPHHLDKDGGMWAMRLHPDGTQTWTSRWGRSYRTKPRIPDTRPRTVPDDDDIETCPF